MSADTKSSSAQTADKAGTGSIVVDLGKQKAKLVKKLRKGEGPLIDDVNSTIDELRSAGTVAANAQVVIVVVREKPANKSVLSMLKM